MNLYKMAALGVVVSIGIAGCDSLDSEARVDRPDTSMTQNINEADCDRLTGNAKDVCVEEAKSLERVAEAEFAAMENSTEENRYDLLMARADAERSVARQRCQDLAGNARDVCLKEADRAHADAGAEAKLTLETSDANETAREATVEAREEAAETMQDAEFGLAREKCDAFAGDLKDDCIEQAKADFAQN